MIYGRYTRPEVKQSSVHVPATAARRLNVKTFESQADKRPSVDDENLKTVTGRATWKTFTSGHACRPCCLPALAAL